MDTRYAFLALDTQGRSQKGFLMAKNQSHAFEYITQKGWYVVKLKPQKSLVKNLFTSRFCIKELYTLITQLHTLTSAHIPLTDALTTLKEIYGRSEIAEALETIEKDVLNGESFSKACGAHPRFFDPLTVAMIAQGEEHNRLNAALDNLKTYLSQKITLKSQLQKAFAYPIFLLVLFLALIAFLTTYLLPPMTSFLSQNNPEGNVSFFWLSASLWIQNYGVWTFIAFVITLMIMTLASYISSPVRTYFSRLLLNMPFMGSILLYQNLHLYFQGLELISRDGQDLPKAMQQAPYMVRSFYLKNLFLRVAPQIKQGQSLYGIFTLFTFMPPVVIRMIKVGEQSNQLNASLGHIGDYLHTQLNLKIERMGRILEPLLLLLMGGILMAIILGLFLPLYSNLGDSF